MFKKTVKYQDFNGVENTEDLYFHMFSPEFVDLQFNPEVGGDMGEFVKRSMASGQGQKLWIMFKLLVVNSYGRRSEDGSKFIKRPEFTEEFLNSPAWEKFFEWLLLDSPDGTNAKAFWEGIVPERIKSKAEEVEKQVGGSSKKALTEMSREELQKLLEQHMPTPAAPKIIEG